MLPRARLAAPRASCSASQLTIGQTLLSDFIRSLLQGVLAFDSAKKKRKKENLRGGSRPNPAHSLDPVTSTAALRQTLAAE